MVNRRVRIDDKERLSGVVVHVFDYDGESLSVVELDKGIWTRGDYDEVKEWFISHMVSHVSNLYFLN